LAGLVVVAIENQLKMSSCPCSDRGEKSCMSLFTVGEIIDIRLKRKNLGYSEEKALRVLELTQAVEAQQAANLKRPIVSVGGKSICLRGYSQVCGISLTSGTGFMHTV
jgi:hypothetical protein